MGAARLGHRSPLNASAGLVSLGMTSLTGRPGQTAEDRQEATECVPPDRKQDQQQVESVPNHRYYKLLGTIGRQMVVVLERLWEG